MELCRRGIEAKLEVSRRTLPELLNQMQANIVHHVLEILPPSDPDTKRLEIQLYLKAQLSTRFKQATSGKRKGLFLKKGKRNNQLQRVHLILQARRKKYGLPGLYGKDMRLAAGKFKASATKGVGYAKSMYIPLARALNPVVKYKIPANLTMKIARWPGSAGYGQVTLAEAGDVPQAILQIGGRQQMASQDDRMLEIEGHALQLGVDMEGQEAVRWATQEMDERMRLV